MTVYFCGLDSSLHEHASDCLAPRRQRSTINWAGICGLDHDSTDHENIGCYAVDSGMAGVQGWQTCQNCEDIRTDFNEWLREREQPRVPA